MIRIELSEWSGRTLPIKGTSLRIHAMGQIFLLMNVVITSFDRILAARLGASGPVFQEI
jgi:hypothetical protein